MRRSQTGALAGICGGGLVIASTYLVEWGYFSIPGATGSATLAAFSSHPGWFGAAAAVMTAGSGLLIAASLVSLLASRESTVKVACGVAMTIGTLTVLIAFIKSWVLPSDLWSHGTAIGLCLAGAALGALGSRLTLMGVSGALRPWHRREVKSLPSS